MRIAVFGGGHGSYAAAADLSEQGHSVALWRRNAEALRPVLENRRITIKDSKGRRDVSIALVSAQAQEALAGAQLIVMPTPAFAQEYIAGTLAPYLRDGQVLFIPPGTFGSYAMMRTLRQHGCSAQIAIAETGTLPYLARKHDVAEVAITMRAKRLPTGVFPGRLSAMALERVRQAYAAIEPIEDALSAALMNAGPIIHPPLILMNAGALEHYERWDIHNEGTKPSVRRVTDALDTERIAIREALGYGGYHFPLRDHYTSDRWMYGDAHDRLVESGDWRERIDLTQHRYMTEDVVYGLALLVSIGRWAKVPTPVAAGLLSIAGAVLSRDLHAQAPRTFEALGLQSHTRQSLQRLLQDGI